MLCNPLLFEYEEVCKDHATDLGLRLAEIDTILDVICDRSEAWNLSAHWLPILPDRDDEPMAQLAFEAKVPFIVTWNIRHLRPAEKFGIDVVTPAEFIQRVPVP